MHSLLTKTKTAMDAVNEALLKETEYPAADKTYKNPWFFKGTEPDSRTGSTVTKKAMPWNRKPSYGQLGEQALEALTQLAKMTSDGDVEACAAKCTRSRGTRAAGSRLDRSRR